MQDIIDQINQARKGKKVVFTNGCFDILHVGHVRYLNEAKSLGDILVLGVNSDKSVRGLKGDERPIQTEKDRQEILQSLKAVDFTIVFDEETPINVIQAVRPDILVKGGDWPIEKIVGAEVVLKNGGEVKSLQFVEGQSTTGLVEKIKKL